MLSVSEIFELVEKAPTKEQKIAELQKHGNEALLMIMQYALDRRVVWVLPPGEPPYRPSESLDQHSVLWQNINKLFHYCKGGNDNLPPAKREHLFIQLLESVEPKDAKLLLAMKAKTLPYKSITVELWNEAFPADYTQLQPMPITELPRSAKKTDVDEFVANLEDQPRVAPANPTGQELKPKRKHPGNPNLPRIMKERAEQRRKEREALGDISNGC
jgi:hypothetical protein